MWFNSMVSIILGVSLGIILTICYTARLFIYNNAVTKGKYKERKKVVASLTLVIAVIGVVSTCLFVIALITGQPYHVWYPFMMLGWFGCLWTALIPFMHKLMKKHVEKAELKKMNVDDLT